MNPLFRHRDSSVQLEIVNIYRWLSQIMSEVGTGSSGSVSTAGDSLRLKFSRKVPIGESRGCIWYNPTSRIWNIHNGDGWNQLCPLSFGGPGGDGGIATFGSAAGVGTMLSSIPFAFGEIEPVGAGFGWLWCLPTTGQWRICNGTSWDVIFPANYDGVTVAAVNPLTGGALPYDTMRLFVGNLGPSAGENGIGVVWYQPSSNTWKIYNGTSWDQVLPGVFR